MEWKSGALVFVVVTAGLALAGCAEGGAQPEPAIVLAEVDNSATRGSISGVVVDDAIRPLAGVNLTLLGRDRNSTTDGNGLFVFEELDPGLYTVSASAYRAKDGRLFVGIQTTAEVVAGATSKVRVVLPNDPTPQPYHQTYKWDAYDEVTLGVVDGGYEIIRTNGLLNDTGLPPLCDVCTFYFHPEGPIDTLLLEAVWEDSVADATGSPTSYYWVLEDVDGEADYSGDYCESPCHVAIDGGPYANVTTLSLAMYPDENWVAYQQRWQVFLTLWYLAPPPDDWSFVDGDA